MEVLQVVGFRCSTEDRTGDGEKVFEARVLDPGLVYLVHSILHGLVDIVSQYIGTKLMGEGRMNIV